MASGASSSTWDSCEGEPLGVKLPQLHESPSFCVKSTTGKINGLGELKGREDRRRTPLIYPVTVV